jgi:hypothetical protein
MKTKNILITIILLIIAGTLIFLLLRPVLTGQSVRDYYTYTKAICDENNFCQDYEITCENNQVTTIEPITGASIQHNPDWEDPRINKSEIICE